MPAAPASSSSPRRAAWWLSLMSHRGIRKGPTSRPIMFRAVLTGMGFTSMNRPFIRSRYRRAVARASACRPLQVVHDHLVALPGHDVGPHGDDAAAADGQQGQGDVVVAGPEGEVGPHAVGDPHGVGHVAAGLLDAADVGVLRQPLHGLRGDGAAGAAGDIVEDGGDGHRVGHGGEVAVHALLVGLVVVGGDEQQAVGPQLLGPQALLHHGLGAVGASAGDDRGHGPRQRPPRSGGCRRPPRGSWWSSPRWCPGSKWRRCRWRCATPPSSRSFSKFTEPSAWKGVTRATMEPLRCRMSIACSS